MPDDDFDLDCQACGWPVPHSEAVWEYADKGTYWEQSWGYHPACSPAGRSPQEEQ
jgi:hypothetical protein